MRLAAPSLDAAPEKVRREQQEQRQQGLQQGQHHVITSAKIPVLIPQVLYRGGDPVVTFSTVFRAKLHKNETYHEQAQADWWVEEARQTIKDAERGAQAAEESDGMSLSAARSLLEAYSEATRALA